MTSSGAHLRLVPLSGVSPIVLCSRRQRSVNRTVQTVCHIGAGVALGLALPLVARGQVAHVLLALAFFACLAATVALSALLGGWVYEWALRSRVDRAATALRAELLHAQQA